MPNKLELTWKEAPRKWGTPRGPKHGQRSPPSLYSPDPVKIICLWREPPFLFQLSLIFFS